MGINLIEKSFTIRTDLVLAVSFFLMVFVGITPFFDNDMGRSVEVEQGSILRQVIFILISSGIFYLFLKRKGELILSSIPFLSLISLAWVALSVIWSVSPDITFRRSVLVILSTISTFALVNLMGGYRTLKILRNILAIVIVIDITSVPFIPGATHAYEGSVAWAGMHGHKNNAGTIASFAAIIFLYFTIVGNRFINAFFLCISIIFLWGTNSKTSIALLLFCIVMFVFYMIAEKKPGKRFLFRSLTIMLIASMIPAIFIFRNLILSYIEDPSLLTGRGYIWGVVIDYSMKNLWLGSGYGAFWQGANAPAAPYIIQDWAQNISHAHSSYFELLASLGVVGLIVSMAAYFIIPFKWILTFNVPDKLGAICFSWLLFSLIGGVTKTIILNGVSPEWISLVIIISITYYGTAKNTKIKN